MEEECVAHHIEEFINAALYRGVSIMQKEMLPVFISKSLLEMSVLCKTGHYAIRRHNGVQGKNHSGVQIDFITTYTLNEDEGWIGSLEPFSEGFSSRRPETKLHRTCKAGAKSGYIGLFFEGLHAKKEGKSCGFERVPAEFA